MASLVFGCASAVVSPGATTEVLAGVPHAPEAYGSLVYNGAVFPFLATERTPTPDFTYERRVRHSSDDLLTSTSFTKGHDDRPALIQVAQSDRAYRLGHYTEYQFQTQSVGRVTVDADVVTLRWLQDDRERMAQERLTLPVVVGPTLFGFVREHWAPLLAGRTVPFRFAVPERLETIGFEVERISPPQADGDIHVEMRASSSLMRLFVKPIVISYTADGALRALDGRVPTKRATADGWADFDAHVEYRNVAALFE